MSEAKNSVECPNCGFAIDVNELLYHQVEEQIRKQHQDEIARERQQFNEKLQEVERLRASVAQDKADHEAKLAAEIKQGMANETKRLRGAIETELRLEQQEKDKVIQEELAGKNAKLRELNKALAENERLKREKDELAASIEAAAEKRLNETLVLEREKIRKTESDRTQLKLVERERVIEQLNEQLKEAQRKAEQGSTQLQGEVQELALEEWLRTEYPLDTIDEIKKGARGADCLQTIHTRTRQNCGTIYYESKRTKGFQPGWIEKFKHDIRERSADIGVLVTESMPADMPRLGMRDGVWICTFDEFKSLSLVLRESVVRLSTALTAQDNKGDKMGMLYDYLTGNEFRLQVEAIVEGFTQMQSDLESEKRSMAGIWKKREKQIQKVLLNTTQMYGSVKGIAGSAIQSVALLEPPIDDDTDED